MNACWVAPGGFDRSGTVRVIPVLLWLLERTARSYHVEVFSIRQGQRQATFPLLGATVHEMGGGDPAHRGISAVIHTIAAIRRAHRARPFDVIHGFWANQSGFVAVTAGRLLGVPVVITLGGGELARLPDIGYGGALSLRGRFFARASLRGAEQVLVASEFAARAARELTKEVSIIPLGVDSERFTPPRQVPIGPPWRFIQISNLNRIKDQPTLLCAFRLILATEPDCRLEIVGADTLHGEVQRLSADLGLGDRVLFRGTIPSSSIADTLQQSHLLLHTSRHESGPVVFLEAAACGVATAGTAVGHLSDLAPEGAAAVSPGDHVALAQTAVRLLRDHTERTALAERARDFALTHDANWTARRVGATYESLTREKPLSDRSKDRPSKRGS